MEEKWVNTLENTSEEMIKERLKELWIGYLALKDVDQGGGR